MIPLQLDKQLQRSSVMRGIMTAMKKLMKGSSSISLQTMMAMVLEMIRKLFRGVSRHSVGFRLEEIAMMKTS
jgi:hypothetical protein